LFQVNSLYNLPKETTYNKSEKLIEKLK